MIVGRDDGAMRQPQRALAEPVVIAIDLPPGEMIFQMHRQPMRQRALAEIVLKQITFAPIKPGKRRHDLVQLGLHWGRRPYCSMIFRLNRKLVNPYSCTSISRGPRSGIASASAATNSSAVLTARPGTPMPLASATKSSVGRSIFNMSW